VIKIYEDYDKTERIAWGDEKAKDQTVFLKEKRIYELSQVHTGSDGKSVMPEVKPYQLPFRHLCNLIQIADCDLDKTIAGLRKNTSYGPSDAQLPALLARCRCAKNWIEAYAPEEFRFRLLPAGGAASLSPEERAKLKPLSDVEKNAIRILRDDVVRRIEEFTDDKSCAEAIYAVAEKAGQEGKALFAAAYQALIGKDQGPRLAGFLRSIGKERLLSILENLE